jgi:hypothetical protein
MDTLKRPLIQAEGMVHDDPEERRKTIDIDRIVEIVSHTKPRLDKIRKEQARQSLIEEIHTKLAEMESGKGTKCSLRYIGLHDTDLRAVMREEVEKLSTAKHVIDVSYYMDYTFLEIVSREEKRRQVYTEWGCLVISFTLIGIFVYWIITSAFNSNRHAMK